MDAFDEARKVAVNAAAVKAAAELATADPIGWVLVTPSKSEADNLEQEAKRLKEAAKDKVLLETIPRMSDRLAQLEATVTSLSDRMAKQDDFMVCQAEIASARDANIQRLLLRFATIEKGSRVCIEGLVKAHEMNGRTGVCTAFSQESGRWTVDVFADGARPACPGDSGLL